jgi:hypothetical protein
VAIRVAATVEQAVGADYGSSPIKLRRPSTTCLRSFIVRAEVYPLVSSEAEEQRCMGAKGT